MSALDLQQGFQKIYPSLRDISCPISLNTKAWELLFKAILINIICSAVNNYTQRYNIYGVQSKLCNQHCTMLFQKHMQCFHLYTQCFEHYTWLFSHYNWLLSHYTLRVRCPILEAAFTLYTARSLSDIRGGS